MYELQFKLYHCDWTHVGAKVLDQLQQYGREEKPVLGWRITTELLMQSTQKIGKSSKIIYKLLGDMDSVALKEKKE